MTPVTCVSGGCDSVRRARRDPGGLLFSRLSRAAEATTLGEKKAFRATFAGLSGLDRSRDVVVKLSALFALDSFGGGFVVQSFAAYWFYLRFGVNPGTLGAIFFWANIFAGLSALLASRLAARFGLIKTMVATHLPSNILLILVPLMPTLPLAVAVLLVRFSISQMDVPTRQSYIMAVVSPEERSAAAGSPAWRGPSARPSVRSSSGFMFARPALINLPFFIAGTLKIATTCCSTKNSSPFNRQKRCSRERSFLAGDSWRENLSPPCGTDGLISDGSAESAPSPRGSSTVR